MENMEHDTQSGINIVNEIMKRGACDRQHASSSQSISIALRFWRICLTHSFFFPCQSLIVCKIWSMYLCHGQAAYSCVKKKKKEKKVSFAIDVYDRRARTRNEYRGFLFIIHLWQLHNTHFVRAMLMRTNPDVK